MANYTLIARINAGNGNFPIVNVQFSKNHPPIPIERATHYLRPTSRGNRTPIRMGKDVAVAHTAMLGMDYGRSLERPAVPEVHPPSGVVSTVSRKTVEEAAGLPERPGYWQACAERRMRTEERLAHQCGQTKQEQKVCNVQGAGGRSHAPRSRQRRGSSRAFSCGDWFSYWRRCGCRVDGHRLGGEDYLRALQTEIHLQAEGL